MPREQILLIPTRLEDAIPEDHPVRLLDELLDSMDWTEYEAAYHGSHGQPPIHPSIMSKILLFAMIRRIRSSRQIEYELKHSIDFMWLASGRKIDHTTLSEFRRKNAKGLSGIFKQMITRAINLGVANLSELCIDGTRVLADANRYKSWTTDRLERALKQLDAQIADALENLEVVDSLDQDLLGDDVSADKLPKSIADMKLRREQLAKLQQVTQEMDLVRKQNGTDGPAQLPRTDTDSRILPNKEGGYAPNYTPMITTEIGSGFIVHCDVVIGNVEHDQLLTSVNTVEVAYETKVERVLADKAYTTGENLTGAEEAEFEIIGPMAEIEVEHNPAIREDLTQPVAQENLAQLPINRQTKCFDRSAFVYDEESDSYYCPAGKQLPHRATENKKIGDGQTRARHRYTCHDCAGCPLAKMCRGNPESPRGREVFHDEHEPARRRQRERMKAPEAKEHYKNRTHKGEVPFAVIKACFSMRRFLLRGLNGVQQEWRWIATAFNIKKLMGMLRKDQALRAMICG